MNTLADKLINLPKMTAINLAQLNQNVSRLFLILLIIACGYTLSQITWLLIPEESTELAPGPKKPASNKNINTNDYAAIGNAHLFGLYEQKLTPSITSTEDVPETRLNLVLKGVLAATPEKFASAIISIGKSGKEDTYSIGDKVSSATLKQIHSNKVILLRSGKLETLHMPKDGEINLFSSSPSKNLDNAPATPGTVLSDIRKKILKNPTSFGQYAIPVPYRENGKLRGYRLKPQGDNSLFDAVGLDPNDVVVAVNGVKLTNPADGLKALRS